MNPGAPKEEEELDSELLESMDQFEEQEAGVADLLRAYGNLEAGYAEAAGYTSRSPTLTTSSTTVPAPYPE